MRNRRNVQTDPQGPLRQMIRRLETSNSIIAGWDIYHHLVQDGKAAAWTSDVDVYFNAKRLPSPVDNRSIMVVTGINNHELGHVLFTPTMKDIQQTFPGYPNTMVNFLRNDEIYQNLFNILEDQRMETLFYTRYAGQGPYLIAGFDHIVMKGSAKALDTAYVLARGRRYLPVKVRRMLKKRFPKQEIIPDIRRIIDSFCKLNLFRGQDLFTAHKLIVELKTLLLDNDIIPPTKEHVCGTLHLIHSSQKEANADVVDKVLVQMAKADEAEAEKPEPADDDQDSQQDDAGNSPDSPADASDDPSGQSAKGEAPDAEDSLPGGGPGGSGFDDGPSPTDADLSNAVLELLNAAAEDSDVIAEVLAVQKYMLGTPDIDAPKLDRWEDLDDDMPMIAKRIGDSLRKLEDEIDPYWERGTTTGKLNIGRLIMKPDDREYAFDRWQEGGLGGVDQEWVVLLDCSGSMRSHFGKLSRVAWLMKRAADLVEAKMTVITFGSQGKEQLVYSPDDKAGNKYPLLGDLMWTMPLKALSEAHKIFMRSGRTQRGLFIMTDGGWDSSLEVDGWTSPETVIDDLNAQNIMTHLTFFDEDDSPSYNTHRCKTHSSISGLGELPNVYKELIAGRMRKTR